MFWKPYFPLRKESSSLYYYLMYIVNIKIWSSPKPHNAPLTPTAPRASKRHIRTAQTSTNAHQRGHNCTQTRVHRDNKITHNCPTVHILLSGQIAISKANNRPAISNNPEEGGRERVYTALHAWPLHLTEPVVDGDSRKDFTSVALRVHVYICICKKSTQVLQSHR